MEYCGAAFIWYCYKYWNLALILVNKWNCHNNVPVHHTLPTCPPPVREGLFEVLIRKPSVGDGVLAGAVCAPQSCCFRHLSAISALVTFCSHYQIFSKLWQRKTYYFIKWKLRFWDVLLYYMNAYGFFPTPTYSLKVLQYLECKTHLHHLVWKPLNNDSNNLHLVSIY